MKMIRLKGEEKERIINEVEIIKNLDNPMIIRYVDSFIIDKKLYVIMDMNSGNTNYLIYIYIYIYIGGTLKEFIENKERKRLKFTEEEIFRIFDQLVFGIKYLHGKNVIHRDLRPENIYITKDLYIKFGDFGLASMLKPGDYSKIDIKTTCYIAPELIHSENAMYEQDIWSLGCLLFEIITLNQAYSGKNLFDIMKKITEGKYAKELLKDNPNCGELLSQLISKIFTVDRRSRPNIYIIFGNWLLQ